MHVIPTCVTLQVLLSRVQTQDLNIYEETCVFMRKIWGDQNYNASTCTIYKFSRMNMHVFNIDVWLGSHHKSMWYPRKKIFSKTAADRGFYHDTAVSIRHTAV